MIEVNEAKDVLLVVDVQNDFIDGSLAVPNGAEVVPVINKYMEKLKRRIFSKDMHPANHSSFAEQGGPWPPHCVAGTRGAELHKDLDIDPRGVMIVEKGKEVDKDAYSAFDGTGLDMILPGMVERLYICGLATDYCVKASVMDALKLNIPVFLMIDAIRGVEVNPGDTENAIREMEAAGATLVTVEMLQ